MIDEFLIYPIKNLWRKKGRSMLTIIGIAIGVASVIIISCIGNCGTTAVNTELDSLGMGGLTISADESSQISLSSEQLNIVSHTNGVAAATPVALLTTDVYNSVGKSESSLIWGVDSTAKDIVSLELMYGRFLNNSDIYSNTTNCMVDQTFAKKMYNKDNVTGRNITITCNGITQDFTIVGVIKTGSGLLQNAMGTYLPNFVYAPYTTIGQLTGSQNYNQIITRTDSDVNIDTLGETVIRKLNTYSGIEDGYKVTNLAKQKEILTNILGIVTLILSAVGAVSLIVASLSIMTVMLVSVSERKREIGIKKSIGATKYIIMREFLVEALLLSLAGCLIGIILGLLISFIGSKALGYNIDIPYNIILLTCVFSSLSGVIFGVYPARKASTMKPAESLRSL
ncbi:MAG TPA: FtsX-like permease family protein [Clostridiales bacterium]|nr:FtsX-like permease family protein [Clostridiales bacterium]